MEYTFTLLDNDRKRRIDEILKDLLLIHSPSRKEKACGDYCIDFLERVGAQVYLHHNEDKYGGDCPTIFAYLKGNGIREEGITLSAHLDVVEPNEGNSPVFEDGIVKSDGTTTLGGDDKGGVASILYIFEYFSKMEGEHRDIYCVLTPGEEAGMLAAQCVDWEEVRKNMDPSFDMAVLDNAGDIGRIAYQAPTAGHFTCKVKGRRAHAGIEPEKGVNAITLGARIIAAIDSGRIDELTTCNISAASSEYPSNVVPDEFTFSGEFRGHDLGKIEEVLKGFEEIIKKEAVLGYEFTHELNYPALKSTDDLKFLNSFKEHYSFTGREIVPAIIGGGSDANFFAGAGFNSIILGVGMEKVHTKEEYLVLSELYATTEALMSYIGKGK